MLIKTIIRLQIGAQSATMGPPLGPTLGQFGVSAMDFVKKFNEKSVGYVKGTILTTIVYVYMNRTYDMKIIGPVFSCLLKKMYNCNVFNGSLKSFKNYQLMITDYMILEVAYFLKNSSYFVEKYSENTHKNGKHSGNTHKNMRFLKSIKGQVRSFGLLYFFSKLYN